MNRIEFIRNEVKKYHDYCYENFDLFEEGSWLFKPVKTLIDLLPLFESVDNVQVLDLGCGVGRNSIPIAEAVQKKNGKVMCVDLLDSALIRLIEYSKKFGVEEVIQPIKADIGEYKIIANEYDLIVAVSTLEHVESPEKLEYVVRKMAQGTKQNGINCIVVNSEATEIDIETNEILDAQK